MDCPPWTELCGEDPGVAVAWYQAYSDHVRARAYACLGGSGHTMCGLFRGLDSVRSGGHGDASGAVDGGGVGGVPVGLLVGASDGVDGVSRDVGDVVGERASLGSGGGPGGAARCSSGDVPRCEVSVGGPETGGGDGTEDTLRAVAGELFGKGRSGGPSSGGVGGKGSGTALQCKRGPNYARNQASRERKKQAKASRRGTVGDSSGSGERKGFFSACDESLQQELRESRARMLILENERKAVQYARDVARMKSPAQLALDVVDLVRRTRDDPKSGADPRIMGWAKTVVSAEVESVAKSAPSSVPSLESVVLSESEGSRASEYKRRYEELVLAYDNADYFNPGDRVDDFRLLQVEFADVVKGDVRTANRFEFAREMQVAIAEAASGGEYACSRAVESLIASAFRSGAD